MYGSRKPPTTEIVESGPNVKEREIGTPTESLELRFLL